MSNKNEVFEYLIGQLRQQVNSNQCEDLAHEVQSLKNQLRDVSALVVELQEELEYTGNEYRRAVDYALSDAPEQSGCRKEDTQGCEHDWRPCVGLFRNIEGATSMCIKCGAKK